MVLGSIGDWPVIKVDTMYKLVSNQPQKLLWSSWGVIDTVRKCFISLILSYNVRKNTYFLYCTGYHVGTGHKLHFQPKNIARAKMAALKNKNGCGTAEVWCRKFGRVSYLWYYHVRSWKRQLCSVVPPKNVADAISSIFSPKIQLWSNWQQPTSKMAVAGLRCNTDYSELFHIIDNII